MDRTVVCFAIHNVCAATPVEVLDTGTRRSNFKMVTLLMDRTLVCSAIHSPVRCAQQLLLRYWTLGQGGRISKWPDVNGSYPTLFCYTFTCNV